MTFLRLLTPLSLVVLASTAHADPYIVTLRGAPVAALSAVDRADANAAIDRLAATHGAQVHQRYSAALRGFAAEMTPERAAALAPIRASSASSPTSSSLRPRYRPTRRGASTASTSATYLSTTPIPTEPLARV